jgi:hypothetical protein
MSQLDYVISEKISLKNHSIFNEAWLQDKIAENPKILGLGEVDVIDRERKQKNGRLDLLLANFEEETRFEVELMLGQTDESHIIRTIEYWDIERKRYPQYDHCAVLIAENVTSRFLNVLSLFNGHIPMIIIQLDALKFNKQITLNFTKVMDRFELRKDDETETKLTETDRNYWNTKATKKTVAMADDILNMINVTVNTQQNLNYNKYYIGLHDGIKSRNFIYMKPKKQFTHLFVEVDGKENWIEQIEEKKISASISKKFIQLTLTPEQLKENNEFIKNLIEEAVKKYNGN